MSSPLRWVKLGVGVSALSYAGSVVWRALDPVPRAPRLTADQAPDWRPQSSEERLEVAERIAAKYDRTTAFAEWGAVRAHRKRVCGYAKGKVLEVGIGTGLNMPFYPAAVQSVLGVDFSPAMLERARAKYEAMQPANQGAAGSATSVAPVAGQAVPAAPSSPSSSTAARGRGTPGVPPPMSFLQADVTHLPLDSDSFDTVLDTFSLCCYADPAAALSEMARVVRKAKPRQSGDAAAPAVRAGRILLLEHGRSTSPLVNRWLSWNALRHCRAAGCQIDQDVEALVRESGMRILAQSEARQGRLRMYVLEVPEGYEGDAHSATKGEAGGDRAQREGGELK